MVTIMMRILPAACLISGLMGCSGGYSKISSPHQPSKVAVAFMPDIHFHDVFGEFEDEAFEGLPAKINGQLKYAKIRTMEAQLNSTRLF